MTAGNVAPVDGERRLLAALKRVLKRLRLPGKLHTFRHSFISNALLNGTPAAVVKEWVGHIDRQVIELYTHVHNSASQAAMQRLARRTGACSRRERVVTTRKVVQHKSSTLGRRVVMGKTQNEAGPRVAVRRSSISGEGGIL